MSNKKITTTKDYVIRTIIRSANKGQMILKNRRVEMANPSWPVNGTRRLRELAQDFGYQAYEYKAEDHSYYMKPKFVDYLKREYPHLAK